MAKERRGAKIGAYIHTAIINGSAQAVGAAWTENVIRTVKSGFTE